MSLERRWLMEQHLNLYYIFFTVAKHQTISGAAKELYISQPAISKAISKLEQNLDTKLFLRSSRGVSLTQEGELLFRQVKTAFSAIRHGENQLKSKRDQKESKLSIGVSITLCKYVLLPHLKEFLKLHPDILVTITCHPSLETIRDIEKGVTDIGLVGMPSNCALSYLPIGEIQDTFVATKQYLDSLMSDKTSDHTDLLQNATVMMLDKENISRKYMDQYLYANQLDLHQLIEINTMDLLIEFAKMDLGIACVIKNFVKSDLAQGTLEELSLIQQIPKRKIGFVYGEESGITPAMKQFLTFFQEKSLLA